MGTELEPMRAAKGTHVKLASISNAIGVLSGSSSFDAVGTRLVKFWSLLVAGLAVFFAWLVLFSRCANVLASAANYGDALTAGSSSSCSDERTSHSNAASYLVYVDIWFALALMAAIDAFAIVLNFNRSLIHQFHYFVSLRMTSLAFIISTGLLLLYGDEENRAAQHPAVVALFCCAAYMASILIFQQLHKLIPARGISATTGSLQKFTDQMSLFDLPWKRTLPFAAINGAVGLALTTLVPAKWSMLNPVLHITWEVTFLGLMGTKQTPRYIWFATPVVQASTCTDWGMRQVLPSPSLAISPSAFLGLMIGGRLLLDLHLKTMFRHRHDFQWARNEVLFSTRGLLMCFGVLLLFEDLGLPVVTLIKPIAVVLLHTFGVLVFLLPASYALAFDKIKTIRE